MFDAKNTEIFPSKLGETLYSGGSYGWIICLQISTTAIQIKPLQLICQNCNFTIWYFPNLGQVFHQSI